MEQDNKLRMNIQLLASEGEENTEETQVEETVEEKAEEKLLTQEQFDKALTKRLEKERKKMMDDFKAQLEEEKRLASLTEAEKLEERLKKIEEREQKVKRDELTAYAHKKVLEAKLPEDALSYLVKESVEDIDSEIEKFSKMFTNSVNMTAEAKIGVGAPQTSAGTKADVQVDSFLKGLGL